VEWRAATEIGERIVVESLLSRWERWERCGLVLADESTAMICRYGTMHQRGTRGRYTLVGRVLVVTLQHEPGRRGGKWEMTAWALSRC
jgi:hypothetical protein